eukprot:Clim_evm18s167 gene=Clim_evmTU18s167
MYWDIDISSAQTFLERTFLPRITGRLERAMKDASQAHGTLYKTDFSVEPGSGVYLQVDIYRSEPALFNQLMKFDHFSGIHKITGKDTKKDAPNLRHLSLLQNRIWGCAQPTDAGIAHVVDRIMQVSKAEQIMWINLREEPICYVNGRPFSPRDPDTLNINLDHLIGIEGFDLERLESRLRGDLVAAAIRNGNVFKYIHQVEDMTNQEMEEVVSPDAFKTVREIFYGLRMQGKPIRYFRIPITDESGPDAAAFDSLTDVFMKATRKSIFVFNCQMGRGRTTTAMVCGYLYLKAQEKLASLPGGVQETASEKFTAGSGQKEAVNSTEPRSRSREHEVIDEYRTQPSTLGQSKSRRGRPKGSTTTAQAMKKRNQEVQKQYQELVRLADDTMTEAELQRLADGNYATITALVDHLVQGTEIKDDVDEAIDQCAQMQNLRLAILECKIKGILAERHEQEHHLAKLASEMVENTASVDSGLEDADYGNNWEFDALTQEVPEEREIKETLWNQQMPAKEWYIRGINYLERYWWLMVYHAYLRSEERIIRGRSFSEWMRNRWELRRLIKRPTLD